jgi:tetratricopeptide (TPR) repeat protein
MGGSILGTVRDSASRELITSARVDLTGAGRVTPTTKYTDLNGQFYFGARDGDYQLIIRKVGYQDTQISVSIVATAQTRVDVDLVPEPSDSGTPQAPPETVSAHQLSVPEKAREDYREGQTLAGKHDYSGAVAQFQKAIKGFPSYYEAYADMGLAQYRLGQAAEARESLQKSVDLSQSKYPDALFDYADVLNALHDFTDAEPLARHEIQLDDSSWRGHYQLARALLGMKRFAEAEQSAREAQKTDAQDPQLYVVLVSIHAGMRHYASVVRDIDAYLALDPNSPMSDQMRATRAQVVKALADAQARSAAKPQ